MTTAAEGQDFVMVPVPPDRVLDVYALLVTSPPQPDAPPADDWPGERPQWVPAPVPFQFEEALIIRAYKESPPAMKRLMDYLADRPGEIVSSREIGSELGLGWQQLAGVLGAFGRRWHNRYRQPKGGWFIEHWWSGDDERVEYRLSERDAGIVRGARSSGGGGPV